MGHKEVKAVKTKVTMRMGFCDNGMVHGEQHRDRKLLGQREAQHEIMNTVLRLGPAVTTQQERSGYA